MKNQDVVGTVRTFIPHKLKKLPTMNQLPNVKHVLKEYGKPFAINVADQSSSLIVQLNIPIQLVKRLISDLNKEHIVLRINSTLKVRASSLGFGQMQVKSVETVNGAPVIQQDEAQRKKSSTHGHYHDIHKTEKNSQKQSVSKVSDKKHESRKTKPLDTSGISSSEALNKSLKKEFKSENWDAFIKKLKKNAGNSFNKTVDDKTVDKWIDFALRCNKIPNNLNKVVKAPNTKSHKNNKYKNAF